MYVFCVGMYRSCSTWQYNVACRLLERHRTASRLGALTEEGFLEVERGGPDPGAWHVLKSHDGNPSFAAALAEGRALALYSYRDLRDVVYSLMHKFAQTFEQVTAPEGLVPRCIRNDGFWQDQPRTLCQRYERLVQDPLAGVREIASHLGIDPAAGEAEALVDEFSLAANRQRAERFADRQRQEGRDLSDPANALLWDPHTMLHWNHIRTGEVGAWRRQADPLQQLALALACGPWLIERGYEPDLSWGRPGLEQAAAVVRQEAPALRNQVEQDHQRIQVLEAALDSTRRSVEELEARLAPYQDIGAGALEVARRAKRLALRFPRLAGWSRRLLRRPA
jgi:hypothetical protein